MNSGKVVVITGASGGIGLEAARLFHSAGNIVYSLSRRDCPLEGVISIPVDVTHGEAVSSAIDSIALKHGCINALVCNAGYGISGAVEFTPIEEAVKQFDVNVFGVTRCISAALKHMRSAGSGTIVITSSVAGAIAIPFQAYYSASKAALNSLTLSIANEVRQHGIKVCAVLPGDTKTGFTDARSKLEAGANAYRRMQKSVAGMERDEQSGMQPAIIAKKIFRLANARNPKPLCSVGFKYQAFCTLSKLLPSRLVNRIVGRLY